MRHYVVKIKWIYFLPLPFKGLKIFSVFELVLFEASSDLTIKILENLKTRIELICIFLSTFVKKKIVTDVNPFEKDFFSTVIFPKCTSCTLLKKYASTL